MEDFFAERGISATTLERNRVAQERVAGEGGPSTALAFPYYRCVGQMARAVCRLVIACSPTCSLEQLESASTCQRQVLLNAWIAALTHPLCSDGHLVNIKYRGLEEKKFWQVGAAAGCG